MDSMDLGPEIPEMTCFRPISRPLPDLFKVVRTWDVQSRPFNRYGTYPRPSPKGSKYGVQKGPICRILGVKDFVLLKKPSGARLIGKPITYIDPFWDPKMDHFRGQIQAGPWVSLIWYWNPPDVQERRSHGRGVQNMSQNGSDLGSNLGVRK